MFKSAICIMLTAMVFGLLCGLSPTNSPSPYEYSRSGTAVSQTLASDIDSLLHRTDGSARPAVVPDQVPSVVDYPVVFSKLEKPHSNSLLYQMFDRKMLGEIPESWSDSWQASV